SAVTPANGREPPHLADALGIFGVTPTLNRRPPCPAPHASLRASTSRSVHGPGRYHPAAHWPRGQEPTPSPSSSTTGRRQIAGRFASCSRSAGLLTTSSPCNSKSV